MGATSSRWQCRLPSKCGQPDGPCCIHSEGQGLHPVGKLECKACKLESGVLSFRCQDEEEVELDHNVPLNLVPWSSIKPCVASSSSGTAPEEPEKVRLPGGATYQGAWLGSEKHGEGVLVLPGGARYEGQFRHDRRWGQGTYTATCGSVCSGQWVGDRQHGHGTEHWADGSRFEGEYSGGEKFGAGVLQWANGCAYEGQFARSMMHGQGSYTWQDGRRYSGQWVTNIMGPSGRMSWPDGRIYIGDICDGRSHGRGTLRWPDGRSYCGQWREGRQHGEGVVRTAKGMECSSRWKEGRFVQWTDLGYFHPPDGTPSHANVDDNESFADNAVGKASETASTATPSLEAAASGAAAGGPLSPAAKLAPALVEAKEDVPERLPAGPPSTERPATAVPASKQSSTVSKAEAPEELEIAVLSPERSPELVPEPPAAELAQGRTTAAGAAKTAALLPRPRRPAGACGCLAVLRLLPDCLHGPALLLQREGAGGGKGAEGE